MPMVLFADLLSPGQPVFTLLMLVAVTFLIRWALMPRGGRTAYPRKGVPNDAQQRDASAKAQMTKLEVRLHDFAREVDGRIQSRMATLDRLILDAEREIDRLQNLLAQSRPSSEQHCQRQPDMLLFPISSASGQGGDSSGQDLVVRVCTLSDAGLCDDDVAVQTGVPVGRVRSILRARHTSRFDAA